MLKPILALAASLLVTSTLAAPDPHCSEYEKLRAQRDNAARAKNLPQYCEALAGLLKLMPANPPALARLKCEAKGSNASVETWMGVRPTVVSSMKSMFEQQCK